MGKPSPQPPPAPDYGAIAAQQAAANKDAAIASGELSMVNQRTPWGSLTYNALEDSPQGNPRYEAVQELSDAQQQLLAGNEALGISMLDTANQQLGRVSDALGQPVSFEGLVPEQVTNIAPDIMARDQVEAALMGRLDPYLQRDRDALETRLAGQGIQLGSEAYSRAMDDYARGANDARLGVIGAAGQEQSRLFNMAAQEAALQNTGRQQSIQELMLQRRAPIDEISALMSGSQVQAPQFVNTPQMNVPAPDIMGAAYASNAAANQNYQAQLAAQAARNQGLFSLLGTGLGVGGYALGGGFN